MKKPRRVDQRPQINVKFSKKKLDIVDKNMSDFIFN